MEGFFPYEGAGFLLFYEDDCIMGIRVKKPEDLAKDPILWRKTRARGWK